MLGFSSSIMGGVILVDICKGEASDREKVQLALKCSTTVKLDRVEHASIGLPGEVDVLVELPEHRNLVRIIFECVSMPPKWISD